MNGQLETTEVPENQFPNTKATAKADFLYAIDLLLPAIEKGGWLQFTEPATRNWINRLAKYAYVFGFPDPPIVIRTITKQGESEYNWSCGSYGPSCYEDETVTVNGPYTKEVVGPVELKGSCQPWHCKAVFALREWREEVESIVTDSKGTTPESGEEKIPNPTPCDNAGTFGGFAPADWFWLHHGIKPERLSEAKSAGYVRSKPVPFKVADSNGKVVRTLYQIEDALKHCRECRPNATSPYC